MSLRPAAEPHPRWRSAWLRLPVMFVLLLGYDLIAQAVNQVTDATPFTGLPVGVAFGAGGIWVYFYLVRRFEGREPDELALSDARAGLRRGTLYGLGLFTVTLAVIAMSGDYHIHGWGSFGGALTSLGVMSTAAVGEELAFRGALFRILEEKTGTWGAMGVSGLVFGGTHLLNPHATVWGAFSIAVEAGLMLGAVYVATRSLWLPIGLHLGWNLAEGGIFGTTVSGSGDGPESLLRASLNGAQAWTGGEFGPEASVVALFVGLAVTAWYMRLAKQRGHIRPRGGRAVAQGV